MGVGARWSVAVVLLALATGFAVAGCFGVWAKRQALETGPWVNTSERVLKNQDVRDELGKTLSDRIFKIDAVQTEVAALPPDQRRKLKQKVRRRRPRSSARTPP